MRRNFDQKQKKSGKRKAEEKTNNKLKQKQKRAKFVRPKTPSISSEASEEVDSDQPDNTRYDSSDNYSSEDSAF